MFYFTVSVHSMRSHKQALATVAKGLDTAGISIVGDPEAVGITHAVKDTEMLVCCMSDLHIAFLKGYMAAFNAQAGKKMGIQYEYSESAERERREREAHRTKARRGRKG